MSPEPGDSGCPQGPNRDPEACEEDEAPRDEAAPEALNPLVDVGGGGVVIEFPQPLDKQRVRPSGLRRRQPIWPYEDELRVLQAVRNFLGDFHIDGRLFRDFGLAAVNELAHLDSGNRSDSERAAFTELKAAVQRVDETETWIDTEFSDPNSIPPLEEALLDLLTERTIRIPARRLIYQPQDERCDEAP